MYSGNNKHTEITRGFRTCGLDDVYASDAAVEVQPGMVITRDGQLATLHDVDHIEVGLAIQSNKFGRGGYDEATGQIPVMVSNFMVRTNVHTNAVFSEGDVVTVTNGLIDKGGVGESIYGYITAVDSSTGTIDVRVVR